MAPATVDTETPWWREPTREQWLAWIAGWLGWTLDAFDFTIFLLVLVPIAEEFRVPLTAAAVIVPLTLWMRLRVGQGRATVVGHHPRPRWRYPWPGRTS